MRLKRSITLMFFFLTSMLLLVHAVLPHYHHDRVICFSSETQCVNVSESDTSKCCQSHQEDHQHGSLEDCDLKNIVIRQDNTFDNELIPYINSLSFLYVLYPLNTFFLEAPEFGFHKKEKPYINNYTSTLYGLTLSQRGPPVSPFLA